MVEDGPGVARAWMRITYTRDGACMYSYAAALGICLLRMAVMWLRAAGCKILQVKGVWMSRCKKYIRV